MEKQSVDLCSLHVNLYQKNMHKSQIHWRGKYTAARWYVAKLQSAHSKPTDLKVEYISSVEKAFLIYFDIPIVIL